MNHWSVFLVWWRNDGRCLGLWADGDELDLLNDVEETYEITIDEDHLPAIETAGELFDAIAARCAKVPSWDGFRLLLAAHGVRQDPRLFTRQTLLIG